MKSYLLILTILFCCYASQAQLKKDAGKKYQSLLWEISGNGLKKPSYLIGTMHVSSKMAFNLPDSFYIALKNAQVVALETNPETWQEDMSKYEMGSGYSAYGNQYGDEQSMPNDYLTINTLKFNKYEEKIQRALYSNPSTINNLLYRSYGNESSDFEEDTYLDMYIYQCGKKWGKKVTGVEDYGKSMQLMMEAYKDAAKEKTRKERSYGDVDENYSSDKLQEAYRTGNLDLLDSINKYHSVSAAFDEKFLYQRNDLQAASIDSIIKSGSSLFVGVGAAHLPGERGVIEILRRQGYKLRPIKMGERASKTKDLVDKIRVPVVFRTETAEDGFYKVDIPGKFFSQDGADRMWEDVSFYQKQYADMANGSYYMVSRIMTNAWMWNNTTDEVYKKVDSLLYENVPGKILSRTIINRNGYKGLDITNRTRRGDVQRYNIFITPFEILFFKMSGNNDYVITGDEAKKFFGSIQFKEYKNGNDLTTSWKKYSPPTGGFTVDLPHEPYVGNDGSWIYDATDKSSGTHFRIIRSDIHNYSFVEEDTFDLGLMEESFKASEFIDSQLMRKQTNHKGYPALDAKYTDKAGMIYLNRYIIRGPHYYTLLAHGKEETASMKNFLNSFQITPFVYPPAKKQTDTALYYSVSSPVFPDDKKIKLEMPAYNTYGSDEEENDLLEGEDYRTKIIVNDTTGEKIHVAFYKTSRYYYSDDSLGMDKDKAVTYMGDSTWIVKYKKKEILPNKMKVWETIITDTGSSRTLWSKVFYKDGNSFSLFSQSDTLSQPSDFVKNFFATFTPADTLKGSNPFVKKAGLFFQDFLSTDTVIHKRAVKHIRDIEMDSADLPQLKQLIGRVNWEEKNYLGTKGALIYKLATITNKEASQYLKELYYTLDDTVQLQYIVLESLLAQQTSFSYNTFRDIINTEPPVLDDGGSDYSPYREIAGTNQAEYTMFGNGNFLDQLTDTLKLTKTILPDLLPLLNLEDYKRPIMQLLGKMVDSNLVKSQDYSMYFSKFLIEAKQELKKQSIAEKKKAIEKAEESKTDKKTPSYYETADKDYGNSNLSLYAKLLLPFWESNTNVQPLLQQMLRSNDKRLKYSTLLLLMKNNKPYPDSMLTYFAGMDDYRYELYTDLKSQKQLNKFPSTYNNHIDLGRSSLLFGKTYNKPDSIIYADRLSTEYKGKKGYIYFFKYKEKKDDVNWKLATVGLVPENPREFEFEDSTASRKNIYRNQYSYNIDYDNYDFTEFTDTKLKEEDVLTELMHKEWKKMMFSRRKSAKVFYQSTTRNYVSDYYD